MKTCIKCSKTDNDELFRSGRNVCKECTAKEQWEKVQETINYQHSLKESCSKCGYDRFKEALDWHHKDGEIKSFNIGNWSSKRRFTQSAKLELDLEIQKCVCLCANCHREFHFLNKTTNISLEDFFKQ